MKKPKIGKDVLVGKNTVLECSGTICDGVQIGNNVILEGKISIGKNTRIDHGAIIRGNVSIGKDNILYPYCLVGAVPQHRDYSDTTVSDSITKLSGVVIGDKNVIREYVSVHMSVGKSRTKIGSGTYIMAYSHIAHDCAIHDNVTMVNANTLGGHCTIFRNANLGFGNNIHQFCKVGPYTMLGMGNNITKDVPPFALMNQNRFTKINRIGMDRMKIAKKDIDMVEKIYAAGKLNTRGKEWYAKEISKFTRISKRGMYMPQFKSK